jgi:hypothetical protein
MPTTATDYYASCLHSICPEAEGVSEGGKDFILLPNLKFTSDGEEVVVDALLCPSEHSGYPTRLFLARAFPSKGQGAGWKSYVIIGRTWYTWSWKDVPAALPLPQILLGHLWVLR